MAIGAEALQIFTASWTMLRTEERGSVGPKGWAVTVSHFRHFCTVVRLIELRRDSALTLTKYLSARKIEHVASKILNPNM